MYVQTETYRALPQDTLYSLLKRLSYLPLGCVRLETALLDKVVYAPGTNKDDHALTRKCKRGGDKFSVSL